MRLSKPSLALAIVPALVLAAVMALGQRVSRKSVEEIVELDQRLATLYKAGRFAEALPLARDILAAKRTLLGDEHRIVAKSLSNLAFLYAEQHQHKESEKLYLQSLAMSKKLLGDEHVDIAMTLSNLAGLYRSQGRYPEAEQRFLEALALNKKLLGDEHQEVARSLNDLAGIYSRQGRHSEAEPLLLRSLAISKKLLGDEHPLTAILLNNLALSYAEQQQPAKAEKMYLQSLLTQKKLLGDEHTDIAKTLGNLARLYLSQKRYREAEQLFLEAMAMDKKLLGDEHPDVAQNLNDLAGLYWSQGRFPEAEQRFLTALAINKKLLGDEHPGVAQNLNNLAVLYYSQGKYTEAEPIFRQALAMSEKFLGEHPDVARNLGNLAELLRLQGRYAEAEPLYQRTLTMMKRLLGNEHPDIATSLNNLGTLYLSLGRFAEAVPIHRQALAMRKTLLGDEDLDVAQSLNNLAAVYHGQGQYAEADRLYRHALAIRRKFLGDKHPLVAQNVYNLATLHHIQSRYVEAEPLYRQALEIMMVLGADHPDVPMVSEGLSYVLWSNGKSDEARKVIHQAIAGRGSLLAREVSSAARRTAAAGESGATLFVTDLQFSISDLGEDEGPVARQVKESLQKKFMLQGSAGNLVFSLLQANPQNSDLRDVALDAIWISKDRALEVIRPGGDRSQRGRVTAAELQQKLLAPAPEETALLEIFRYRELKPKMTPVQIREAPLRYVGCVLRKTGLPVCKLMPEYSAVKPTTKTKGPTKPKLLAEQFISISSDQTWHELRSTDRPAALDDAIEETLLPLLQGVSLLYMAPDGVWNNVDWRLMISSSKRTEWGKLFHIAHIGSGRDLLWRQSEGLPQGRVLLASSEPATLPLRASAAPPSTTVGQSQILSGDDCSKPLPPLPGLPPLLRQLGQQFGARPEDVLHRPDKNQLFTAIQERRPLSRLLLAGHGCQTGNEFAIKWGKDLLPIRELAEQDLSQTVVYALSCLGGATARGMLGDWRQVATVTGARLLLAPLRNVEVEPTGILVSRFEQALQAGERPTEALRLAQQAVATYEITDEKGVKQRPYDSSYHWSGWIVIGLDQPVATKKP